MTLARVAGSLAGPWDLVRRELDAALGEPTRESGNETEPEWRWSRASRLFTLRASANPAAGRVEVAVDTRLPYASLAALAGVLAAAVFLSPAPAVPLTGAALSLCLLLTLVPLVPGWVHFRRFHRRTGSVVDIDTYRITPAALPPLGGVLIGLWTAGTGGFRWPVLLLSMFLCAVFAYATAPGSVTLRRQFPVWALAFFSGVPLLLTGGNVALLVVASDAVGPAGVAALTAALVVNTLAALYAYVRLCRRFLEGVDSVPNRPIDSRPLRVAWFGAFLTLNVLSVGAVVAFLAGTWPVSTAAESADPTAVATAATAAFTAVGVPFPRAAALVALAVLTLPLVGLLGLWGVHLVRRMQTYRTLRARTRPIESTEIGVAGAAVGAERTVGTGATARMGSESGATAAVEAVEAGEGSVPVRVLATPRAVAFATQSLPGRDAIVVSTGLLEELTDEEVAAVIAHEEYHVRNGDPRWNLLASLFGAAVGGRNALVVARDYPRVEREADRHAAREHGTETFVRALRRLERLRATLPPAGGAGGADAEPAETGPLPRFLAAPYRVLFGAVVLENAHASTDERIAAVLADEEG
ncbi:hypothetical protein GCM10027435_17390 [Haloparvum alkalitolerans]|uniref:M56 family metallopeptidase n=1 Tax=Haloparvum alkalitolerans TaxID=1042953 RepID=UPI003CF3AE10